MLHTRGATGLLAHLEGAMRVGLLGTGFGIAHARIYHTLRCGTHSSSAVPHRLLVAPGLPEWLLTIQRWQSPCLPW